MVDRTLGLKLTPLRCMLAVGYSHLVWAAGSAALRRSGFGGKLGSEWISIDNTAGREFTMLVFGYAAGTATVEYRQVTWQRRPPPPLLAFCRLQPRAARAPCRARPPAFPLIRTHWFAWFAGGRSWGQPGFCSGAATCEKVSAGLLYNQPMSQELCEAAGAPPAGCVWNAEPPY